MNREEPHMGLHDLTNDQLRELAEEHDVAVAASDNKDTLVEKLVAGDVPDDAVPTSVADEADADGDDADPLAPADDEPVTMSRAEFRAMIDQERAAASAEALSNVHVLGEPDPEGVAIEPAKVEVDTTTGAVTWWCGNCDHSHTAAYQVCVKCHRPVKGVERQAEKVIVNDEDGAYDDVDE